MEFKKFSLNDAALLTGATVSYAVTSTDTSPVVDVSSPVIDTSPTVETPPVVHTSIAVDTTFAMVCQKISVLDDILVYPTIPENN